MNPEVRITVWWPTGSKEFRLHRTETWGWRVTDREGIPLLIIREDEGSGIRHEIPLENVLYFTVDASDNWRAATTASDIPPTRGYNWICRQHGVVVHTSSNDKVRADFFREHERCHPERTCCGSLTNSFHRDDCPIATDAGKGRLTESQQRFQERLNSPGPGPDPADDNEGRLFNERSGYDYPHQ